MCANDLVAAWGAQKLMEQWGIPITIVSGPVTDNQTGTDYISQEMKLPAANAKTDGRALFGIVYEEIQDEREAGAVRSRSEGARIFGASGYAGGELLRLLLDHPKAEPVAVISRSQAGQPVSRRARAPVAPDRPGVHERAAARAPDEPEVIFLAGAHGYAVGGRAGAARHGHPRRRPVGGLPSEGPGLLREVLRARSPRASRAQPEFVYGLPELFRDADRGVARGRVARLLRHGVDPRPRASLARGTRRGSGARLGLRDHGLVGRGRHAHPDDAPPAARLRFLRVRHRRPPPPAGDRGIALGVGAPPAGRIVFQTHSAPARARHLRRRQRCRSKRRDGPRRARRRSYEEAYGTSSSSAWSTDPRTSRRQGHELRRHRRRAPAAASRKVFVAIDNLVKGAAGQAIQAMNIMFGLPEPTGLKMTGVFP